MPAPRRSSTDLYIGIDGCGRWSATIPYGLESISGRVETTKILELAITRATEWFIREYMPLRFNAGYARSQLGYSILARSFKKKQRRANRHYADAILPNVWTGETRRAAMAAHPETTATGGRRSMRVNCKIRMNLPGYVNMQPSQVTNQTLRNITAAEGARIAAKFFAEVSAIAANMQLMIDNKTGKMFMGASFSDRASFGSMSRQTILSIRRSARESVENAV